MISTSLLLKKNSQTITAFNDAQMTHLLTSGANVFRRVIYLCKRTIFWTFRPNPNVCLRFCDQKKKISIRLSSDLEIRSKGLFFTLRSCRLDWIVQIKFGLILDILSDLVDQTNFWSDLEDKTERLSSLEKFMQIRTKTEVWSKN